MPTWETNGWKTAEGKPVVNRTDFKELREAAAPLEITWHHVPSHRDVEGNEAADQLARTGIHQPNKNTNANESGTFPQGNVEKLTERPLGDIVNVSPDCTSSENTSNDEVNDKQAMDSSHTFTLEAAIQESIAEFEQSMTNQQSYFWDQEGLDQPKNTV